MIRNAAGAWQRWSWAMLVALLASAVWLGAADRNGSGCYFVIHVVDEQTGRGVPLAELTTVNEIFHVTDSAGRVAFDEPGLMDREVFFHVRSHGYEFPKDMFDFRGLKLTPRAGESAMVKLKRLNIAERLYRLTGAGIYRDSVLAGLPTPLMQPTLSGGVLGQDTVITTPYRGRLHWFWGDTNRAAYPLGNFAAAGATSQLPSAGGLDPAQGVDFSYFVDEEGFAKKLCPDFGKGLHWIESVFTVRDASGAERLVARISSQEGMVAPYAWHLAVFNDEKAIFESKIRWPGTDLHDSGHPFRAQVNGAEYLYIFPNLRVKAEFESALSPQAYEAFTCVGGDGKSHGAKTAIERTANGAPQFSWKRGADRLSGERLRELLAAGVLKPEESWGQLRDIATGAMIPGGRGSVFWNEYRRRWVRIASGSAGEVWFAEADTPTGPWAFACRVVSHTDYNFYNPTQHPWFDQDGGRMIYFEGTYTASFSAAKTKTPRYDYNQIMYRLRLDDPKLSLPVAVYRVATSNGARLMLREKIAAQDAWTRIQAVEFFACRPDDAREGLVTVYENERGLLTTDARAGKEPLFRALPGQLAASAKPAELRSDLTGPLNQFHDVADGGLAWSVDAELAKDGIAPLCYVWRPAAAAEFFARERVEPLP